IIEETTVVKGCETFRYWFEGEKVLLGDEKALCVWKSIEWTERRDEQLILRQHERDRVFCERLSRRLSNRNRAADVQQLNVGRDTLMHLVGMGLGVSLTSEATIATPFPKVVFRPIVGDDELIQFSAAWLPHNDNPALRRFLSQARVASRKN